MKNDNKKQLLLLIIGLVVLIGGAIGLTYAFFSYIYNGEEENSIKTGTIFFTASDTYMELSNVFPTTLEKTDKVATVSVQGYTTYEKGIDFMIKAIEVKSQNPDIIPTVVVTREDVNGITYTDGKEDVTTYDKNNRLTADSILCAGNIAQGDGIVDLTKILTIKVYYDMNDYHISDNTKEQLVASGLLDANYAGEIIDTATWNALSNSNMRNKTIAYSFRIQVIAVDGEEALQPDSGTSPIITITSGTKTTKSLSVNYTVDDSNSDVTCEYGTTKSYGSTGSISGNTCTMSGLSEGTTYYYRLTATNSKNQVGYAGGKNSTVSCQSVAGETCENNCNYDGNVKNCKSSCSNYSSLGYADETTCINDCMTDTYGSCIGSCMSEQVAKCKTSNPSDSITIDTTAPVVSVGNITKTGNSLTIPYTYDDSEATISCEYGTDETYGNQGTISGQACIISGLDYETEYFYKITATDVAYNSGSAIGSTTTQNYCDHTLTSVTSTCNSADYSNSCSSSDYTSECQTSCTSSCTSSCTLKCTGSVDGTCSDATCGQCMGTCSQECNMECNTDCISGKMTSCVNAAKKSCITNTMNSKGCTGY